MNAAQTRKPNRLIHEKSPYLLQHAYNPVDWYAWGDEAFNRARAEQKPIFLSVGYSTCHWCHVMEHESFENDSIAAIMNRYFVCIKVDREERPDVDKVYMTALQGMGENGGWPMSMFLTPDLKPFYGGTYFPPETRYGRIGFPELLARIHEVWENERGKVVESANGIADFLKQVPAQPGTARALDAKVLDTCFQQFSRMYDPQFGGFGPGPKFPRPVVFAFLLRYFYRTGNANALEMVARTLEKMSVGGVYDHIGGGFHRYSVDGEWRVPHFEKMLYDQAQMATASLDLFQITHDTSYETIAREVLDYVIRDMTHPEGGFFSAEDADSPRPEAPDEEGEGAFYIWSRKEIHDALGGNDGNVFSHVYGVEEVGNALADPQHEFTGKNILYVAHSIGHAAREFGISESDVAMILARGRKKLFEVRKLRPRPRLDDKILTSWNGLMISAFSRAYQVLDDPKYLNAAERAAAFIFNHLYDTQTATLKRRFRDGEAKYDAHLDDYTFFVQGLLDLYEASLDFRWLESAIDITNTQINLFYDREHEGFFETSGQDSSILVRLKEYYDGAEPSGNSIAVMNLLRLAQMTDNADWRAKAGKSLDAVGETLQKQPVIMPQMAAALDFSLTDPKQIVIVGDRTSADTRQILREVHAHYLPHKIILLVDGGGVQQRLAGFIPFVADMSKIDGKATAYICEHYVCQLPTTDITIIGKLLERKM